MSRLFTLITMAVLSLNAMAQSVEVRMSVGGSTFRVELEDSETGRAFASLLPQTISMEELNGNEKYCYLSSTLPTDASCPGTIHEGDLLLYGSSCVVVFYETFKTSYSYTRIGRIADTSGLKEALGSGDVQVSFAVADPSTCRGVCAPSVQQEAYALSGARAVSSSGGMVVEGGKLKMKRNK